MKLQREIAERHTLLQALAIFDLKHCQLKYVATQTHACHHCYHRTAALCAGTRVIWPVPVFAKACMTAKTCAHIIAAEPSW